MEQLLENEGFIIENDGLLISRKILDPGKEL